jgi:hypothetical protein
MYLAGRLTQKGERTMDHHTVSRRRVCSNGGQMTYARLRKVLYDVWV